MLCQDTQPTNEVVFDHSQNKQKRKYKLINDEMREKLISLIINDGFSIIVAAEKAGINYENAKAIYRVYREDGRLTKKKKYNNHMLKLKNLRKQLKHKKTSDPLACLDNYIDSDSDESDNS